jgi:hypothetical protein
MLVMSFDRKRSFPVCFRLTGGGVRWPNDNRTVTDLVDAKSNNGALQ